MANALRPARCRATGPGRDVRLEQTNGIWRSTSGALLGRVLHTLNIRLFPEQVVYVANHAAGRGRVCGCLAAAGAGEAGPRSSTTVAPLCDHDRRRDCPATLPNAIGYEELLARRVAQFDWPRARRETAPARCAIPRGRPATRRASCTSHRSMFLHSFSEMHGQPRSASAKAIVVLPVVPMFHANAWGLPSPPRWSARSRSSPAHSLYGRALGRADPERSCHHPRRRADDLDGTAAVPGKGRATTSPASARCRVGGSAVPRGILCCATRSSCGAYIAHAWDMTETSPLASVAHPPAAAEDEEHWDYRSTAGRIMPLVQEQCVVLSWPGWSCSTTGSSPGARGPIRQGDHGTEQQPGGDIQRVMRGAVHPAERHQQCGECRDCQPSLASCVSGPCSHGRPGEVVHAQEQRRRRIHLVIFRSLVTSGRDYQNRCSAGKTASVNSDSRLPQCSSPAEHLRPAVRRKTGVVRHGLPAIARPIGRRQCQSKRNAT